MTQGWLFDSQFLRKCSCQVNFLQCESLSRPHIEVMAELCSSTDLSNTNTIMRSSLYISFWKISFSGERQSQTLIMHFFPVVTQQVNAVETLKCRITDSKTKFPVPSPATEFLKDRFQDHSPQSIWLVPLVCFSKELLTWINSRYRGYFLVTWGRGTQSSVHWKALHGDQD